MEARRKDDKKAKGAKAQRRTRRDTDEYGKFTDALRRVLRVSHSELRAKLHEEKAAKKRKALRHSASPA